MSSQIPILIRPEIAANGILPRAMPHQDGHYHISEFLSNIWKSWETEILRFLSLL